MKMAQVLAGHLANVAEQRHFNIVILNCQAGNFKRLENSLKVAEGLCEIRRWTFVWDDQAMAPMRCEDVWKEFPPIGDSRKGNFLLRFSAKRALFRIVWKRRLPWPRQFDAISCTASGNAIKPAGKFFKDHFRFFGVHFFPFRSRAVFEVSIQVASCQCVESVSVSF